MALIYADRVLESSTTTGTGAMALAGAIAGFRAFSTVCATNDTVYYAIWDVDSSGNASGSWETGLGTYSAASTLTRTTVIASSNAGAAVTFAAGTRYVAISPLATVTGTVTNVSGVAANGVSFSIATATTTPAITITLGAITPTSVAATGTVTGSNLSGTNTGDQTITLTGDVTGSGTGSFAATIAASAVTLAKMANVNSGTIFYRKTASAGAPEVQTLATLKTDLLLTGTNSGDQTITLTGDVTGSGTGSFAVTIASSVALGGAPTAATAAAGTSTTQIASTAFVDRLRDIPQVTKTASYTLALTDRGGHVSITTGGVVIPANSSVAFPIGSTITIYNDSASTQTIAITTDTMLLAGTATTGTRTLAGHGLATLLKVKSTTWVVTGNVT